MWTNLRSLGSQEKVPMGRCTKQKTKTPVSVSINISRLFLAILHSVCDSGVNQCC